MAELIQNPIVVEMFEAFSGFFSFQECHQALRINNMDPLEASSWLVEEGERERGKRQIVKKRSLLIAESEVVSENQTKKNEIDIVVKQDSPLYPTNVTCGKWTINDGQLTYHNLATDNGYIKIFSIRDEDTRIISQNPSSKDSLNEP